MTTQSEIIDDPNYIAVLDHGFVGLVDHMGDDAAIVQAARVSYGAGTKTVREDRGLIRYLFRHRHTSPVEMCEVKFHVRLPIFIMRQLVRHRTASLNEYSGRYSVMTDDFYMPELDAIQAQSSDNKQGRNGDVSIGHKEEVRNLIGNVYTDAYGTYQTLLNEGENQVDSEDGSFPGIARELARVVLPVGNYTECYFKMDLHNLFHMLKLRLDPHAQYEIRAFAEAMYVLVQQIFPLSCEAFEDYSRQAHQMSRMDMLLIKDIVSDGWPSVIGQYATEKEMADSYGMSLRELRELKVTLGIV